MLTRKKQRVTSLSKVQEEELVLQGWQCWDSLLYKCGHGTVAELRDYVADPERFVTKRKEITISMSDQIPVWIKADGDRCLVRRSVTTAQRLAKRRRTSRKKVAAGEMQTEAADEQPMTTKRTPGNTANSRYRVTLIARQVIHNYFRPETAPQGSRALHNSGFNCGEHYN